MSWLAVSHVFNWILGLLDVRLYASEEDMDRNVVVFLVLFCVSVAVGGFVGFRRATKSSK